MSATLLRSASLDAAPVARSSNRALLTGRILTGLAVAFLVFDTVVKLNTSKEAVEATTQLGWSVQHMPILAMMIWGGLYLRDARVRAVLGPRR